MINENEKKKMDVFNQHFNELLMNDLGGVSDEAFKGWVDSLKPTKNEILGQIYCNSPEIGGECEFSDKEIAERKRAETKEYHSSFAKICPETPRG